MVDFMKTLLNACLEVPSELERAVSKLTAVIMSEPLYTFKPLIVFLKTFVILNVITQDLRNIRPMHIQTQYITKNSFLFFF